MAHKRLQMNELAGGLGEPRHGSILELWLMRLKAMPSQVTEEAGIALRQERTLRLAREVDTQLAECVVHDGSGFSSSMPTLRRLQHGSGRLVATVRRGVGQPPVKYARGEEEEPAKKVQRGVYCPPNSLARADVIELRSEGRLIFLADLPVKFHEI